MTVSKDQSAYLFQQYQEDFSYCENIIKEKSKSFYSAFSKLPLEKANSVYAIYAFCREADDSIDLYHDKDRLMDLKHELEAFQRGHIPQKPIWRALSVVFQMYQMDYAPFYEMIEGQEMDSQFAQPDNQGELETYCYYVASTVGLMLLPILSRKPLEIREQGIALGIAMQLTNILRDVGEDAANSRVYFPKEQMAKFGYTLDELNEHLITPAFIKMWESEACRAESLYQESLSMLPFLESECREPVVLAVLFYQEILAVVRKKQYQCFEHRQFVGKSRKIKLYQQAKKYLREEMVSIHD